MPNLLHFNLKIISAPTHYHDSHKSAKSDHLIGELQWRDCISHTLQGLGGEFANFTHFTISTLIYVYASLIFIFIQALHRGG